MEGKEEIQSDRRGGRRTICEAIGRTSDVTKENSIKHNSITTIQGKMSTAHLWIWISLDDNQMFALKFSVTTPGGSSFIGGRSLKSS